MITIIGAGLAGYQLAREIRKTNPETPLTIVTADEGRFYSKPQLSTALTMGKNSETLVTATAEKMAEQLHATVLTQHLVTAIDPQNKKLLLEKNSLSYEKLVLACGADVIQAPLEGDAIADVLSINHIYHYAAFEKYITNKKNILILGAGLIGCEFANDLSNAGYSVDVIAPANSPLDLLVPEKIGKILQDALEKNGVKFHFNCVATTVNKRIAEGYNVTLSNGKIITTDFILSAIGLRPHVMLAKTGGIKINRGILVNRYLETNVPDIYALGDCAEVEGHVLPFITPILNCTRALAKTLTGSRTPVEYPAMPVVVKTPAHPIVICPPPKGMPGDWSIEIKDNNVRGLFYNKENQLHGFVLTNEAVKERMQWVKQLPALF